MEDKNAQQEELEMVVKPRRRRFLFTCLFLFVLFYVGLSSIGLAPLGVREIWQGLLLGQEEALPPSESAEPEREVGVVSALVISKIGLETGVRSPATQDDKVLERALQEGPVHYPGSGLLGTDQNILIFGHSSGLPVVRNPNYKVFNRLKELRSGDEIVLRGANAEFAYAVESVEKVLAGDARIDIGKRDGKLVLSTCNVWGAKEERFVVTARFVKSYPLES